jgi:hypothetical protein
MQNRAPLAGLAISTMATATFLALACSTSTGADQNAHGSHPTSGTPTAAPAPDSATASPSALAPPPAETAAAVGSAESINEPPDAGTVMNNAQPAADAGSSDRLEGIKNAVLASREKFRACFDTWAKTNAAGKEVNVMLSIKLNPDGSFVSAAFDTSKTDLSDKTAESCMVEVAKSLSYPASPSGKETTYRHPFVFKARK